MPGCRECPTLQHLLHLQLLCGTANILLATVKDARMRMAFAHQSQGAAEGNGHSRWQQVGSWFAGSSKDAPGSSRDVADGDEAEAVLRVQQWLQQADVAGASHCKTD
jgi:hypothetical protein